MKLLLCHVIPKQTERRQSSYGCIWHGCTLALVRVTVTTTISIDRSRLRHMKWGPRRRNVLRQKSPWFPSGFQHRTLNRLLQVLAPIGTRCCNGWMCEVKEIRRPLHPTFIPSYGRPSGNAAVHNPFPATGNFRHNSSRHSPSAQLLAS